MTSIDKFNESLGTDSVNMFSIIESILKYKTDIKVLEDIQKTQLEILRSSSNQNEKKLIQKLLLDSANQDFLFLKEKIDTNFTSENDKETRMKYLTKKHEIDIKSIVADFKNLNTINQDGYIKKFHNDETLKTKKAHKVNINNLLYMYISNYILYNQEEIHDLFARINTYLTSDSLKKEIKSYLSEKKEITITMTEILKTLEKHIKYIYSKFYDIYEIEIKEPVILQNQLTECLKEQNSILFITINEKINEKTKNELVYTGLCVTKDQLLTFIQNIKYPCNYDDPVTYVSMPIGTPQKQSQNESQNESQNGLQKKSQNGLQEESQNGLQEESQNGLQIGYPVYISYLSAIMIYRQNTKHIFYLLRKKESPDITSVNKYCDIKDNIPIMYVATCAGDKCYKK